MNGRKSHSKAVKKRIFVSSAKQSNYGNDWTWREDIYGRVICFASYGDENSAYGWNIHHVDGNSRNNKESNLIALHFDSHREEHGNE